ncbi:MAG: DUF1080 domain-containing protein [Planctomycetia bacterium]|nr:DUF1080 domain-containing protein [Planctomycetia bacterium]
MKTCRLSLVLSLFVGMAMVSLAEESKPVPEGFVSLFDGKTLAHWDGDPKFWSVEDGCLTGRSTPENPVVYNTFLIWDGEVANFELQVDFRLTGGNSGIQYRAFPGKSGKPWSLGGYQGDIAGMPYMGIVYGEQYLGIMAQRGTKVVFNTDGSKDVETFADAAELAKSIDFNGWNTYRIVADGNHLTHYINGVKMSEIIDNTPTTLKEGKIGFQMHVGNPMTVKFKNVFLKKK